MHIPVLVFSEGGWCEELRTSYAPGPYQPRTEDEYRALAPFAVDPLPLEEDEDTPDAPKRRGRKPKE